MEIRELSKSNNVVVSKFMSMIKPEWWDEEGAINQLNKGIGWYLNNSQKEPMGWVLCKPYKLYNTLEIECLGYSDLGRFKIGEELQPLVEESEKWGKESGFEIMRFIIGSRGLSCHNRKLGKPWKELKDLRSIERQEFDWFMKMGYIPSGIIPNIYGKYNHGVLLLKTL